jgi:hypothetical protein
MCNEGNHIKIEVLEYIGVYDTICESGQICGVQMWGGGGVTEVGNQLCSSE